MVSSSSSSSSCFVLSILVLLVLNIVQIQSLSLNNKPLTTPTSSNIKTFHFGGGCFWAPDDNIKKIPGIISSSVGYCGDDTLYKTSTSSLSSSIPTYDKVCGGRTNLVEAVRVEYDSNLLSYNDMLDIFAKVNTATWANKRQYRGIIFTSNKEEEKIANDYLLSDNNKSVVAEVEPMSKVFYTAERYHQNYWGKWRIRVVSLVGACTLVGAYGGDLFGDDLSQKVYNGIIWAFVLFSLIERRFFYGQEVIEVE